MLALPIYVVEYTNFAFTLPLLLLDLPVYRINNETGSSQTNVRENDVPHFEMKLMCFFLILFYLFWKSFR